MGLQDNIIKTALRIGLGRFSTKKDINNATNEIIKVAKEIRKNDISNI